MVSNILGALNGSILLNEFGIGRRIEVMISSPSISASSVFSVCYQWEDFITSSMTQPAQSAFSGFYSTLYFVP